MKRGIVCLLFLLLCVFSMAQKASDIKKDASCIYGEGTASDTRRADSLAVEKLIDRLASMVKLPYDKTVTRALVGTYREDVIKNSEIMVSSSGGRTTVLRYMRAASVDGVYDARRRRVDEMKHLAGVAEEKLQMDVALRYYSWAAELLQSVPGFKAEEVAELRSHRVRILEGLNVSFDCQNVSDKQIVELNFTYEGRPVRNIDYRFFDGKKWSGILSAQDGKGFMEASPGSRAEDWRILYESSPAHLEHVYREVKDVQRAFAMEKVPQQKQQEMRQEKETATTAIDFAPVKDKIMSVLSSDKYNAPPADSVSVVSMTPVLFTSRYESSIDRVCRAISSRDYASVRELFTDTGYDIFLRLISYGKARVLSYDRLSFYSLGEDVYCRSIPMVFSFEGNSRQFVENVVLTFDSTGLISNLTFSLGRAATSDICSHANWTEEARLILVDFLENYKTAYALKRLDYISSIFDEDALIITGRVLKNASVSNAEFGSNRYVRFTRQNKATYVENLSRVFASQEFINIQFSDSEVVKLGKGEQLFGIKIRQEYFSTTYSDVGYLFVLVDLSDYQAPVIHVRTWQESPDKDFGVIGPYHF